MKSKIDNKFLCFPTKAHANNYLKRMGYSMEYYVVVPIMKDVMESQGVPEPGYYIHSYKKKAYLKRDYEIGKRINKRSEDQDCLGRQ